MRSLLRRLVPHSPPFACCHLSSGAKNKGAATRYASINSVTGLVKRKNPVCIAVVDAADFDGTCLPQRLSKTILNDQSVILAIAKADRMPRLLDHEFKYMRRRFEQIGPACLSAHAVSTHTGVGVAELAAHALTSAEGTADIMVFGARGTGKSTLVRALANAIRLVEGKAEDTVRGAKPAGSVDGSMQSGGGGGGVARPSAADEWQRKLLDGRERVRTADFLHDGAIAAAFKNFTPAEELVYKPTNRLSRVKCFADDRRSLWDTPGIPLQHTMAARVPPELAGDLPRSSTLSHALPRSPVLSHGLP